MPDGPDYSKVHGPGYEPETRIGSENAALKQEVAQLRTIFKQRDAMAVSAVAEGIRFMLADAQAGDPAAKQVLKLLTQSLRDAEDLESPLTVIRNAPRD